MVTLDTGGGLQKDAETGVKPIQDHGCTPIDFGKGTVLDQLYKVLVERR